MNPAVFRAAYAEWKVIKTRAAVQLIFEIPIERADEAYQVLGGMPIAAHEVWCGIARLKGGDATETRSAPDAERTPGRIDAPPRPVATPLPGGADKERRKFSTLPYPQQAALRCQDASFRAFLRETNRAAARNEAEAREYVIEYCNINSRAEIRPGTEAETYWLDIDKAYDYWLTEERATA